MNITTAPSDILASLNNLARQLDALATRSSRAVAIGSSATSSPNQVRNGDVHARGSSRATVARTTSWLGEWKNHHYRRRLARWQRTSNRQRGFHA